MLLRFPGLQPGNWLDSIRPHPTAADDAVSDEFRQAMNRIKAGDGQGQYVLRATSLLENHLHTVSTNLEGRALRALRPRRTFYLPMHNRGVAELRPPACR